jgi:hypothetical protein
MSPESIKTLVDIVSGITTTLATVFAGVWGYYRFIKGRLLKPRITLTLDARCVRVGSTQFVACRTEIVNVGLVKVDIVAAHLRISSLTSEPEKLSPVTRKLSLQASWVEPGGSDIGQEAVRLFDYRGIVLVTFRVVLFPRTTKWTSAVLEIPASPAA